ncbi:hypothetical protein DV515_00008925, partial [Chloebia gouldiae]
MSGTGAALRGHHAALRDGERGRAGPGRAGCAGPSDGLSELRARRDELSGRIRAEEVERGRLQARIATLTRRLSDTSESLAGLRSVGSTSMNHHSSPDLSTAAKTTSQAWDAALHTDPITRGPRRILPCSSTSSCGALPQLLSDHLILDNSQTLLDVMKKEMGDLGKAIDPQNTSLGQQIRRQKLEQPSLAATTDTKPSA